MRSHGTRACYVYGPEPGQDWTKGCRCADCSIAAGDYEVARRRAREAGVQPFVDNSEAREHLLWLQSQGVGLRSVQQRSGVGRTALSMIRSGERTRSRPETVEAILAVHLGNAAPGAHVDASRTHREVADLLDLGWSKAAIARAVVSPTARALQFRGPRVLRSTADKVHALWEREMTPTLEERRRNAERRAHYRALERERQAS